MKENAGKKCKQKYERQKLHRLLLLHRYRYGKHTHIHFAQVPQERSTMFQTHGFKRSRAPLSVDVDTTTTETAMQKSFTVV